jgi:hypothetical protein
MTQNPILDELRVVRERLLADAVSRHRAGLSPRDDDSTPAIAHRLSFALFASFCSTFYPRQTAQPSALPDQSHSLHGGWRWVGDEGKKSLWMDGEHASTAGEYLGGLMFYEFLYGTSAVGNTFRPQGMDADYARFLQETAHKAVEWAK